MQMDFSRSASRQFLRLIYGLFRVAGIVFDWNYSSRDEVIVLASRFTIWFTENQHLQTLNTNLPLNFSLATRRVPTPDEPTHLLMTKSFKITEKRIQCHLSFLASPNSHHLSRPASSVKCCARNYIKLPVFDFFRDSQSDWTFLTRPAFVSAPGLREVRKCSTSSREHVE